MLPIPVVIAALLQGVPGHRYTLRMTTDHGERVVATVREDGRSARIDFENRRSGGDGYILLQGGEVVVVHPDQREYSVVDDSTFVRIVGVGLQAASEVGVVRFRVRDAQFTPQRGHRLRHLPEAPGAESRRPSAARRTARPRRAGPRGVPGRCGHRLGRVRRGRAALLLGLPSPLRGVQHAVRKRAEPGEFRVQDGRLARAILAHT